MVACAQKQSSPEQQGGFGGSLSKAALSDGKQFLSLVVLLVTDVAVFQIEESSSKVFRLDIYIVWSDLHKAHVCQRLLQIAKAWGE